MQGDFKISPKYSASYLRNALEEDHFDRMIDVFRDRTYGWFLKYAKQLNDSDDEHCGFAVLKLLFSYFEMIEQQINRGKKLINNIRNLSEIEESEMPLEPVDVFENLGNATRFVQVNFPKRDIDIKIEPKNDKIHVLANELLLDVFENIFLNSIVYNRNETVQINVIISEVIENSIKYAKLEFKDNGIGIDDTRKDKIFQKIHRKSKRSKGMGLGLSLVAKLIDLCDGKIWVEDRIELDYSKGSNFIIQIPIAV